MLQVLYLCIGGSLSNEALVIGTYLTLNMIAMSALLLSCVLLLALALMEGKNQRQEPPPGEAAGNRSLPKGAKKSYTSTFLKRMLSRAALLCLFLGLGLLCVGTFFQHPSGIQP
jgi:hypothetical protein